MNSDTQDIKEVQDNQVYSLVIESVIKPAAPYAFMALVGHE